MDTKRLLLSVTITLSLLMGYRLLVAYIEWKHPTWLQQINAEATTQPVGTVAEQSATGPTTGPSITLPAGLAVAGTTQPVTTTLGSDTTAYPLVMAVDPQGAGLDSVVLSDYYDTAAHKQLYKFEEPLVGYEPLTRPLATRTVTVNGVDVDVSQVIWKQTHADRSSVTYVADVTQLGVPVVELTKQFTLLPRNAADQSQGFDVPVRQGLRNLGNKPVKLSFTLNGPVPPTRESDLSEDRRYVAGYDDGDKTVDTGSTLVTELKRDKPNKDMLASDTRPMLWIGACSSYFATIIRPDYIGQSTPPPIRIASATASWVDPGTQFKPEDAPTSFAIGTSDFVLAPGASATLDLHAFFGPKKRALMIEDPYYANFPLAYDKTMVYSSGICGYITFSWLIAILSFILRGFHFIFRDWGIAIIGLVCLVRLLLHPITKRSQINMMQMSKKAPEIERLKLKYKDNKEELQKAMMEVMNPAESLLGCLPMLLQTPIWIALWNALQSTFELRQAPFLQFGWLHLTWIADLSHPDALFTFAVPISILGWLHLSSINILPALMAVVFYIQMSMQPVPQNMTPEQEQQRKIQKWMPLMFPIMLYNRASGLNLYILTSTAIGIVENKVIRNHIKQQEEAEKAGKVMVDPGPTRNSKQNKNDKQKTIGGKAKKPGGLAGWMADLQAKAEEIRREAERRAKDRA